MADTHRSKIELRIELDENKIPETLSWTAEDGGVADAATKAMLLSIWDPEAKETLSIDLWTKDMPVDEMKLFFHQTLVRMASTFEKATQETEISGRMRDFAAYFAEQLKLYDER